MRYGGSCDRFLAIVESSLLSSRVGEGFESGITENSVGLFGLTLKVAHFDENLGNGAHRETCRAVRKIIAAG